MPISMAGGECAGSGLRLLMASGGVAAAGEGDASSCASCSGVTTGVLSQ
jgi:hypothetical protein